MLLDYTDLLVMAGLFLAVIMAVGIGIKAKKNVANLWLVCFLLSSGGVLIVKFLYSTGYIIYYPHWFKINYPAGILRPVFIYLYIHYLIKGINKVQIKHFIHFLPFVLLMIYLFPFLTQSAEYKLAVLNREVINTYGLIPSWFVYFQISYSMLYIIAIFFDLRAFSRQYSRPSKQQRVLVKWIRFILWGGLIYIGAALMLKLLGMTQDYNYYLYEIFSLGLILLCIKLLTLPELVNSFPEKKYAKSWLTDQKIDKYYASIIELMVGKAIYKREDLKLNDIAQELNLPEYLISQIINQKTSESFRNFVNAYRVEQAKQMLASSHKQYSIEGIAKDVGFNSRASFYNAFKRETNLTPTEYLSSIK
ncbi:helix-turn-helix domain-containing protein [Ekhidna sp.]|uniref:helix-turn-helix domain-containing protein n=1 Tax=Ekhidna sp. TaxID=2608089 RepID=UPI003B512679